MDLITRAYNDTPIQRRRVDGYVNATAMCKANGKLWNNYWRTDRASSYLEALSSNTGKSVLGPEGLVISLQGGDHSGTWVHERVAVDLARWLSPQFAVWMDGWFVEETKRQAAVSEAERKRIDARIKGKVTRIAMCDELHARDVDGLGIAQITNVQYRSMFGKDAAQLRQEMGIKKGTPRDLMKTEDLTRVHLHEFALTQQTKLQDHRGNDQHLIMAANTSHALEKLLTQPILSDVDTGSSTSQVFKAPPIDDEEVA